MILFCARRWPPEELAKRLCRIVEGTDSVYQQADGHWNLGIGNNWWLVPREDEAYLLHYRYERGAPLHHLAAVLNWLLDVEILQVS